MPHEQDFEPALYWKNMPQKYMGGSELVRPISVSEEFAVEFARVSGGNSYKLLEDIGKMKLEIRVKQLLQGSDGNLVVLEDPVVDIPSWPLDDLKNRPRDAKLTVYARTNGELYKFTPIKK